MYLQKMKLQEKSQNIRIDKPSLNEEEINEMVKSAQVYEEQDRKRKELITIKNQLDTSIYQAEKMIKENSDKLSKEAKELTEKELQSAKEYLQKADTEIEIDELNNLKEKVSKALQKIGSEIYQSSQNKKDENSEEENKDQTENEKETEKETTDTINADYDKKEED